MIHRLRRKFILIAMTSVTLVLVLMCLSINIINFWTTNGDLKKTLQVIYNNQGTVPQFHNEPPGKRPDGPFTVESAYSTRYFVLRYSADGTLESADMRHIAAVTESDAESYLAIAIEHGEGYGYIGKSYKYYVAKVGADRYMAIFLDCSQELRSFQLIILTSIIVVTVCIILVFVLILLFSKQAIAPAVKSAEKQKQFITDASHELKTPLTVIATSLKVLELEVGQQKWIDKAQAQTSKLTELVNDLVALSRLDEEKPFISKCIFDISSAVLETAESFRDVASAKGHALELDIFPGLTYNGNEYMIHQLVSILMDNAVKYTDVGCPIRLSLKPSSKGISLTVQNACLKVAPDELDKLFDRFYRADKARSKQNSEGFGVGLSIAQGIVEAHRGIIRAECPEPGMIQFTVVLRR